MNSFSGGCHCNNISFNAEMTEKLSSHNPRACDCSFCIKHSASYISDPNGILEIVINDESNLKRYHVGSGIADFLICKNCGVLVGVCYEGEKNKLFASINSKALNQQDKLGKNIVISPKQLSDNEKIQRWKTIWFSNVVFNIKSRKN